MADVDSFEAFLREFGRATWEGTRRRRECEHHGGNRCSAGLPPLLGGLAGHGCAECETSWIDCALELWTRGKDPLSKVALDSAYTDAQRKSRAVDGMAARPKRDLGSALWAAPLRKDSWVVALATEMVQFASSSDVSLDEWPYERFEDRVPGIPMSVHKAVEQVLELMYCCNPEWTNSNIGKPMSRRLVSAASGFDSFVLQEIAEASRDLMLIA